ncbi:hypothetical protein [Haloarcula amylovorans]|uniref:hypothetical protein n=1 Tax=Haloarcula amylovorans TaxID=2562280 RepID=UPI001075DB9F|nr:hypothetical protein [Halomicroarcula amylolytica]
MPPKGYQTITVSEETAALLAAVMEEYSVESKAAAVDVASTIALERDEAELARLLAERLD